MLSDSLLDQCRIAELFVHWMTVFDTMYYPLQQQERRYPKKTYSHHDCYSELSVFSYYHHICLSSWWRTQGRKSSAASRRTEWTTLDRFRPKLLECRRYTSRCHYPTMRSILSTIWVLKNLHDQHGLIIHILREIEGDLGPPWFVTRMSKPSKSLIASLVASRTLSGSVRSQTL